MARERTVLNVSSELLEGLDDLDAYKSDSLAAGSEASSITSFEAR